MKWLLILEANGTVNLCSPWKVGQLSMSLMLCKLLRRLQTLFLIFNIFFVTFVVCFFFSSISIFSHQGFFELFPTVRSSLVVD